MKVESISQMTGGWFIGNFEPSVYKADFEVGVKTYSEGEFHAPHHHKIATEINYLIRGHLKANGVLIQPGQIFVFEPYEIAECEFLSDCEILVVKTASVKGDKYDSIL